MLYLKKFLICYSLYIWKSVKTEYFRSNTKKKSVVFLGYQKRIGANLGLGSYTKSWRVCYEYLK